MSKVEKEHFKRSAGKSYKQVTEHPPFIGDDNIDWDREAIRSAKERMILEGPGKILYYIRDYFKDGDALLDLGCNIGRWAYVFKDFNCNYEGLDASPTAIKIAREKHPDTIFHHMNALDMNFYNKYDIVFTHTVMQHVRRLNQVRIFNNIYNALKPGGLYIMREMDESEAETHHSHEVWLEMLKNAQLKLVEYIHRSDPGTNTSTYIVRK